MATTFRISLHAESQEQAETAADAAFKRIAALNAVFSDYEPNSELMKLVQHRPQQPFNASDELFDLLSRALELSQLTNGAFDITCGNLTRSGGVPNASKKLPPADRLAKALAATDWRAVQLDAKRTPSRCSSPACSSTSAASPKVTPPMKACAFCASTASPRPRHRRRRHRHR
jgi:thiamine biosynthesis lipoprotein